MRIVEVLGAVRDGGSCSNCGGDYRGAPYQERRGKRVVAESDAEPGLREPVNVCRDCFDRHGGGEL